MPRCWRLLAAGGTRLVALRAAGFNNVDLEAAERLGLTVVRVPAYSPHAVAEFTVGLLLALDRRIHSRLGARPRQQFRPRRSDRPRHPRQDRRHRRHRAHRRPGGAHLPPRLRLRGARLRSLRRRDALKQIGVTYTSVDELIAHSDIISLHCPLTPETHHLIGEAAVARAKHGVILINTSRGALIDAEAVIAGLKSGQIGGVALDVYEQEADLFFEDLSNEIIQDDVFQRLLTFPNVLITGHQAFFTEEALTAIAETTMDQYRRGGGRARLAQPGAAGEGRGAALIGYSIAAS